ncbi:hypothetical protein M758_UG149300 [Ceratodon purpureus]|nr:hypothetical protein M758_UG149300 [Ceratodon purpureus]
MLELGTVGRASCLGILCLQSRYTHLGRNKNVSLIQSAPVPRPRLLLSLVPACQHVQAIHKVLDCLPTRACHQRNLLKTQCCVYPDRSILDKLARILNIAQIDTGRCTILPTSAQNDRMHVNATT